MAAKLKVIKTQNEFNILTSEQTLGKKTAVLCFFNGADAGAWKGQLAELNDLAGDLFERASLIGVDARFFQPICEKYRTAAGQAAVFTINSNVTVVELTNAAIRAAVKT
jgi:hypothetical protein